MKTLQENPLVLAPVKFSILETDKLIDEMDKYSWWMAWSMTDKSNLNVLMMPEECHAEFMAEVAKALVHYQDKPYDQLKALAKRMIHNRAGELKYRFGLTHRKLSEAAESLEDDDTDFGDSMHARYASDEPDPAGWVESAQRVEETRRRLSPEARMVLDAILKDDNGRVSLVLAMSMIRSSARFKEPKVTIKPWHVSEALCIPESKVKRAFIEIAKAYKEVIGND